MNKAGVRHNHQRDDDNDDEVVKFCLHVGLGIVTATPCLAKSLLRAVSEGVLKDTDLRTEGKGKGVIGSVKEEEWP